jgi:pentachlorophenol monooxygenase/3-(3-hydroxy-phenyl)propionate hydroxylase
VVDSGCLSEPFWYVDSPLTTPNASHPFAGRPPRYRALPPAPGVLIPDVAIALGQCSRLREICRDGLLLLAGHQADLTELQGEISAEFADRVPSRIVAQTAASPDGNLATTLASRPDEVWVVRPDAHIAAVLNCANASAVTQAVRRVLGYEEGK